MKETNTGSTSVDWMENERVKAFCELHGYGGLPMVHIGGTVLNKLLQIVAEEAVKDNRKWISVDERLPDIHQYIYLRWKDGSITNELGWCLHHDQYSDESDCWAERIVDTPPPFTK